MVISSGDCPLAALAKAAHLQWPLASRLAVPALAAAPPAPTLDSGTGRGPVCFPYPQGLTFTAFLFFLKVDRLVQLTGFPPVGS